MTRLPITYNYPAGPGLMAARAAGCARSRAQGAALVLVLWFLTLLVALASGFAFVSRTETLLSHNHVAAAQAQMLAEAGVERAAYELFKPYGDARRWKFDGRPHLWEFDGMTVRIVVRDESAKLDLNKAPEILIRQLLKNAGLNDDDVARLADAIADWTDADDFRRTNGAEVRDYEAAGRDYRPANAPFESIDELRLIMGMTPELFQRLRGSLSVYSWQKGFNSVSAPAEVLMAVPDVDRESVGEYLVQRNQDWAADRLPPPFPPAKSYWGLNQVNYNIVAQAETRAGATYVRETTLRLANPVLPDMVVRFTWLEADRQRHPEAEGEK